MKFTVNERCIGCTLCASICPAVFSMNDDGLSQAIDQPVDPIFEASAINAMNSCPVSAIEAH